MMRASIVLTTIACAASYATGGPITEITEIDKLVPGDLDANDHFGASVDIGDGLGAVGSRLHDDPGLNDGAVYIYDIQLGSLVRKLIAPDNAQGGGFGSAVSLGAAYLLVGKPEDRDEGIDAGAVYVFNTSTGGFITKIGTPDGAGSHFGQTVAVEGDIAVIGAPESGVNGTRSGRAFIYNLSTGALLHTLEAQTPQNNALFGCSVAIEGGLVLVGARRESPNGVNSGAAYLFDAATGAQRSRFTAPDNALGDQFGNAVGLTSGLAVIGAIADGDNGAASGSAYAFDVMDPSNPVMTAKLLAPDGQPGDELGASVDITVVKDSYRAVVGAWRADPAGGESGSAYAFDLLHDGSLFSSQKLIASDASDDALLGSAIAIDESGVVLVGAPDDNSVHSNGGGVYVYEGFGSPFCPADLNNDGLLNFFDVSIFLTRFQAMGPGGDYNGDGSINFFDVSAFLSDFNAGCP